MVTKAVMHWLSLSGSVFMTFHSYSPGNFDSINYATTSYMIAFSLFNLILISKIKSTNRERLERLIQFDGQIFIAILVSMHFILTPLSFFLHSLISITNFFTAISVISMMGLRYFLELEKRAISQS